MKLLPSAKTLSHDESSNSFGQFLKFWRGVHQLSQEELAHRIESSPRHISRLENGSSRPSQSMVEQLAAALNLGRRDQSHLMLAAGYAPVEPVQDFHSPEMKWLRKAMVMKLQSLDPYPASVIDSAANILMVNRGWLSFYSKLLSPDELADIRNFYDFLFDSRLAGEAVSDWSDTLSLVVMSIQQSVLLYNRPEDRATLERLLASESLPADWRQRAAAVEPMASFRVEISVGGQRQRFFSVSTMVGALGPTAFVSEPRLTVSVLYPEEAGLELQSFLDPNVSHPLLPY